MGIYHEQVVHLHILALSSVAPWQPFQTERIPVVWAEYAEMPINPTSIPIFRSLLGHKVFARVSGA
jgi:hypothetical protein